VLITATDDILSTVQLYLDGLYEGDTVKLRSSFHPIAHLHSVADGKQSNLSLDDWCKLVEGRTSAKDQNFDRQHERILQIEEFAPNCASVTLRCAMPGRLFTDHLSLVKSEGRWQIVDKVFHADPLA
jgi:hypothetical protein